MASITAFLVVLTLTGEPVVNALCFAWCDTSSETMNRVEAIAQNTMAELTPVAGPACEAVLTVAPFLREEGRDTSRLAVTTVSASVVPPDESHPATVQRQGSAADGRSLRPLILRI